MRSIPTPSSSSCADLSAAFSPPFSSISEGVRLASNIRFSSLFDFLLRSPAPFTRYQACLPSRGLLIPRLTFAKLCGRGKKNRSPSVKQLRISKKFLSLFLLSLSFSFFIYIHKENQDSKDSLLDPIIPQSEQIEEEESREYRKIINQSDRVEEKSQPS